MPEPSETSPIVEIEALTFDTEQTTYDTLIASTIRRSTWLMIHIGMQQGFNAPPLARYDIAIGEVGKEIDLLPDLGYGMSGGNGTTGGSHVTTSFPFVIPQGVRVSCRIRNDVSTTALYDVAIRLIQ